MEKADRRTLQQKTAPYQVMRVAATRPHAPPPPRDHATVAAVRNIAGKLLCGAWERVPGGLLRLLLSYLRCFCVGKNVTELAGEYFKH